MHGRIGRETVDGSMGKVVGYVLLVLLLRRHLRKRMVVRRQRGVGALSDHSITGSIRRIGGRRHHRLLVTSIPNTRRFHMYRGVVIELRAAMVRTRSTLTSIWHSSGWHRGHPVITGHE
jgi:hypothetical protein